MKKTFQSSLIVFISLFLLFSFPITNQFLRAVSDDGYKEEKSNNGKHLGKATPTPTFTQPTFIPTPTQKEISTPRPIPHGKQTFSTWFGSTKGLIDPYDPPVGSSQVVQLQLTDSSGITDVQVIVTTDASCSSFPLSLSSGTNTNGIWTGSWVVDSTYDFVYLMSIQATNAIGKMFQTDLTLR